MAILRQRGLGNPRLSEAPGGRVFGMPPLTTTYGPGLWCSGSRQRKGRGHIHTLAPTLADPCLPLNPKSPPEFLKNLVRQLPQLSFSVPVKDSIPISASVSCPYFSMTYTILLDKAKTQFYGFAPFPKNPTPERPRDPRSPFQETASRFSDAPPTGKGGVGGG